ncbi:MAG: dihydropteroate synthase [Alphaproteobacteria bacterium]
MPRSVLTHRPDRCLVMGILNVTPDSFSGDGLGQESDILQASRNQAHGFVQAGADILDVGGESTRPGATLVDAQEETARIVPVIRALRADHPDVAISIDTYKADVARHALEAGADIVNDVWALQGDPDMASVVRDARCPVILMHNRSRPGEAIRDTVAGASYTAPDYGEDFMDRVIDELKHLADNAQDNGIDASRITLDPGVGFGKTPEQNMALIDGIDRIAEIGFPVLLGASRKSFLGKVLNLPGGDRKEATLATTALAVMRGAAAVRVHDVAENVKLVRMTEALLRSGRVLVRRDGTAA